MKKLIILAIFMAVQTTMFATVWRVNNMPNTDAHFTTLQAAHNSDNVLPGDTLYLEASSGSYGNLTATKPLVIIGAGYFHAENPDTQANLNSSITGIITFNAGSDGSSISGCTIERMVINASNILIERNRIFTTAGSNISSILLTGNTNNLMIRQNFIAPVSVPGSSTWFYLIRSDGTVNNAIISNNYFSMGSTTSDRHRCLQLWSGFSGNIINNVFNGGVVSIANVEFANNIMTSSTLYVSNSIMLHNLGHSTQFGTENGNQSHVNMDIVFAGDGSTDGRWQLADGSPAIGAGVNGTDCGMYGGNFPYVLSGIPKIPTIYRLMLNVDNVLQHVEVDMDAKTND